MMSLRKMAQGAMLPQVRAPEADLPFKVYGDYSICSTLSPQGLFKATECHFKLRVEAGSIWSDSIWAL